MEPSPIKPTEPTEQQFTAPAPTVMPQKSRKPLIALVLIIVVVLIAAVLLATHHKKTVVTTTTNNHGTGTVLPAAEVTITANGFSPSTIDIKKGQTVTWLNQDTSPHQPASDPYPAENALPGFVDDTALTTGQTYGFKFDQTGTFTYHDHLNPLQLKGTVIVK